jgi:hypothetical protein
VELLAEGSITLTAVGILAPHLTANNHFELLNSARHRSKREVEHLVAKIHPRPDVPSSVRRLPAPKPCGLPPAQTVDVPPGDGPNMAALNGKGGGEPGPLVQARSKTPVVLAPLAPERYKVQFTVGRETFEKLRRAQDLLRHSIPNGDPAAVFDRALTLLLAELDRTKLAATDGAPLLARADAVPRQAFSNSITWCHTRVGVRRSSRTSSFDVRLTTRTRRRCTSVPASRR